MSVVDVFDSDSRRWMRHQWAADEVKLAAVVDKHLKIVAKSAPLESPHCPQRGATRKACG